MPDFKFFLIIMEITRLSFYMSRRNYKHTSYFQNTPVLELTHIPEVFRRTLIKLRLILLFRHFHILALNPFCSSSPYPLFSLFQRFAPEGMRYRAGAW